jgi:hypothetical protein
MLRTGSKLWRRAVTFGLAMLALMTTRRVRADEILAGEAADEPVYVVTAHAVRVLSVKDLPRLRAHPCKPKGDLGFYRAPPGILDHCHGRFFLGAKLTSSKADVGGVVWDRTTGAVTGGYSLWGYEPRYTRMLVDAELGGGSGIDGEFTYEFMVGHAFAVPGPALRGGMSLVLRGAPELWHSRWELPALELAWVFADGALAAELGVRGAPVIVGRFNLHESSERLGEAIAVGPYGVVSHRGEILRTMLLAELARFERERPVHEIDARLCSGTGTFMFCARTEHRWAVRERAVSSAFEASGRATTVAISAAFTAP